MTLYLRELALLLSVLTLPGIAQTTQPTPAADLRYVVYLSRHGVRSPTGKASQYNLYSTGAWPEWPVQPGYLTPHGFHLIEQFGAYDRRLLSAEGLLEPTGCADATHITLYADSDQRTRETGQALASGLMPGCTLPVQGLHEGTHDPLFHALGEPAAHAEAALATAAIAGRIGGNPENLARAFKPQLDALDHILACGKSLPGKPLRTSLFDIPATLTQGSGGDHLADLKGPLNTASTLAENLLLEYTEGMPKADVGWGCAGPAEIDAALALHAAATDYTQRTAEIARPQAANLLEHIRLSLEQAAGHRSVAGALGKPGDRALFLVAHDTNQENVAGLLDLDWIVDGRRDDTPPGGALVFELWQERSTHRFFIQTYFTAQTLEQMRQAIPLDASQAPERVPIFIPGCGRSDMSCDFDSFLNLVRQRSKPGS